MQNFKEYVNNLERKIKVNKKDIMFVCIGTNDILWDSVGPLVGSYLKNKIDNNKVLGDCKRNICNKNDLILYYPKLKNKLIIAIDSALSNNNFLGEIFINKSPIIMGLGINENKGKIGDFSIKIGVSNCKMIDEKYVNNIANFVALGIYKWYKT